MSRAPKTTEDCGCKHNGTVWLAFCDAHRRELEVLRAEWRADYYRTARPDKARTVAPVGAEGLT